MRLIFFCVIKHSNINSDLLSKTLTPFFTLVFTIFPNFHSMRYFIRSFLLVSSRNLIWYIIKKIINNVSILSNYHLLNDLKNKYLMLTSKNMKKITYRTQLLSSFLLNNHTPYVPIIVQFSFLLVYFDKFNFFLTIILQLITLTNIELKVLKF